MSLLSNAVLGTLPVEEVERLEPFLQRVRLDPGQVLFSAEEPISHLWFPESGAVTRLMQLDGGESVEVGTIGSEGVAGLPVALGRGAGLGQCSVQIPGTAIVMSVADFDEHVRKPRTPLLAAMLSYASVQMAVVCRLAACHCLHRVEQRLVRCLLELDDRGASGPLRITHDTLAAFLGVHRPSITYALQALAAGGALAVQRRRIQLLDRDALAALTCECYASIKQLERAAIPPRP